MTVGSDPRGLVLVDKSPGWTSHDVVARLRRVAGTKRVGHAGTLDPMATGLLVLGIGQGTRLLTYLVGCDKTYEATIRLGQSTVTDDAEGEVTSSRGAHEVIVADVEQAVSNLRGDILQVPSSVSAIKVDGKRSYARVRGGEEVVLPARPVRISRFSVMAMRTAVTAEDLVVTDLDVIVDCSSGTYIRALARDLGEALGSGGHLVALRRTKVGAFDVADASTVEALLERQTLGETLSMLSLAQVAGKIFAVRALEVAEAIDLGHGKRIEIRQPGPEPVAAVRDGELVALLDESGMQAKPLIVFPPPTTKHSQRHT